RASQRAVVLGERVVQPQEVHLGIDRDAPRGGKPLVAGDRQLRDQALHLVRREPTRVCDQLTQAELQLAQRQRGGAHAACSPRWATVASAISRARNACSSTVASGGTSPSHSTSVETRPRRAIV